MLTLRQGAELLGKAIDDDGQLALAAGLGFPPVALPLDDRARAALRLGDDVERASVVRGPGALRMLLVALAPGADCAVALRDVAASLAAATSHVLWLVCARSHDAAACAIGCWTAGARGRSVAALVTRPVRIAASDAETVCALAAAWGDVDSLVHARWHELLGREALSRRFYRTLERCVQSLADSMSGPPAHDRRDLALLCTSRLLFLSFVETKGWLNGDHGFLARQFDDCMCRGGRFHERVLLPLCFGTLNTPVARRAARARAFGEIPFLNGGLFARTPLERRHARARFGDGALGHLFGDLLGAYRFTARESDGEWSEASVDPEMLGRAFESLMAAGERRTSGAFYTPQPLVRHLTDCALGAALQGEGLTAAEVAGALDGRALQPAARERLCERLRRFTVLDPSCGSGAFLVFLLERLARLAAAAGDQRPPAVVRRELLARSIHGVDVNPTAVWLCELRLWLAVVIESGETRIAAVPPLPNLDCSIRVGDALAGEAFTEPTTLVGAAAVLLRLRERYARASGARKAPLRRALAREERVRALAALDRAMLALATQRRERLRAARDADLFGERIRASPETRAAARADRLRAAALRRERCRLADGGALPFSWPSHFGAAHAAAGFGLVVGNPPWVRPHNLAPAARQALRARYAVLREPAWSPIATAADGSPRGFAAQVDLAALFIERSVALAAPRGIVALLVPSKLWRSLSGGSVRRLLARDTTLVRVEDWSEAPNAFDAAVYPSVVMAMRTPPAADPPPVDVVLRRRSLRVEWRSAPDRLLLRPRDSASPYLLVPPQVRAAFDRVAERGAPLSASPLGRATLGVKCGCNDAFLVRALHERNGELEVEHRGRRGTVEPALVRPLVRGEQVERWRVPASRDGILWTHDAHGAMAALPRAAARWLAPWRRQLSARTDLRGGARWWSLFRTEGAEHSSARVVWSDFGRVPCAAVLAAGDATVPLNSCYVLPCDDPMDALALTALLNSPLAAAWLNAVAEPARGGWRRYLAWTVSLLPLPADWPRARSILAPLAEAAMIGAPPSDAELLRAACRAYRLRESSVEPLVAW